MWRLLLARLSGGTSPWFPLALGGSVLVALAGLLLPWVGGPDADRVVHGSRTTPDGVVELGSRAGLQGGDGLLLAFAALVAVLLALLCRFRAPGPAQRTLLTLVGLLMLAWSIVDIADVGRFADAGGGELRLRPSVGGFVSCLGALAVIAAGVLLPLDPETARRRRLLRAAGLADRGRHRDALEEMQGLMARPAPATVDPDGEIRLREGAIHALMTAMAGQVDRADQAVRAHLELVEGLRGSDPEELHHHRVEAARTIAVYDAAGALTFLDGLRREAHGRWGPGHERSQAADRLHEEIFTAYYGRPPY
ncbi:hypothetical protein PWG71_16980 [Nocardiopsis sp. N85]|uniref:hypothetical protein n=1 Tax=Nocardiopsis sp. N85 TaxID=3029400 RepID=UPI00237F11EC|nr:hypothetical protein [Nocardiopsis sp. N85]MDE3723087.1 hypothetical protein [Nocardiopsis sp. N85]